MCHILYRIKFGHNIDVRLQSKMKIVTNCKNFHSRAFSLSLTKNFNMRKFCAELVKCKLKHQRVNTKGLRFDTFPSLS